jgi:hypothetical protein
MLVTVVVSVLVTVVDLFTVQQSCGGRAVDEHEVVVRGRQRCRLKLSLWFLRIVDTPDPPDSTPILQPRGE